MLPYSPVDGTNVEEPRDPDSMPRAGNLAVPA